MSKKLAAKLDKLKRVAPKRSRFGQLYANKEQTAVAYKRIVLHTLFVSHESTLLLRPHVFESKRHRTPAEWAAWFASPSRDNPDTPTLEDIHRRAVLPGLEIRTNKQWSVKRIIGWVGNAKYATRNPVLPKRRNQTKRKGRKNG